MIHKFDEKGAVPLFPKDWGNSIVEWISGIHSPTGTINVKNTLSPEEKSMAIDVDVPELIKLLNPHFVKRGDTASDEDNKEEEKESSNLYPFKTEKHTSRFVIYLPQESFVVDNAPVSITSGLSACSEKGADWYYLPTPDDNTGKRWYLRVEESSNSVSGSVSIANADNNTSVRFMPIASISSDGEGTMQYIVGSVFGMKVGDSSADPGSGSGGGDDIGQITANPPYLTVRKTHYTDKYSGNEIPEIWIKVQGLSAGGIASQLFTSTGINIDRGGIIQGGGRGLCQSFYNRPSNRAGYAKDTLKPLVTFRYLLGDESMYDDTPWVYCGSKREFETGSFDIYALIMQVAFECYSTSYYTEKYWVEENGMVDGWPAVVHNRKERRSATTRTSNGIQQRLFVVISNEPISANDIQITGEEYAYAVQYYSYGSGTEAVDRRTYNKEFSSVLSRGALFAGKVATISGMEVTQVNTFSENSENEFAVVFKDWDGTTLKSMTVAYKGTAVPPSDPTREGYEFTGWDRGFLTDIMTDTTITATYSELHTVTFVDWDGTVLKTEKVANGQDATPPSTPTRENWTFTRWNDTFTGVFNDKTIQALYDYAGED